MRVGIDVSPLCQTDWGGVHYFIDAVVRQLVEQFPEEDFVLFGVMPRALVLRMEKLRFGNHDNVVTQFVGLPARLFWPGVRLWQGLSFPPIEWFKVDVDVFHSFDWFCLPSKSFQTMFVFDVTPELFPEWHFPANRAAHEAYMQAGLARSEHIFVLSQATERDVRRLFSVDKRSMSVVYPGMRLSVDEEIDEGTLSQLPEHYFLFVGTIEPRKNVGRLLNAYELLPNQIRQKFGLVLVGSWGWAPEKLRQRLRQNSRVVWFESVDDAQLSLLYSQAEALVLPSLYEGFGLPVLEAARFRVPVVTSNVASMPEILKDAAVYIEPTDATSIASGLKEIFQMEPQKKNMLVEQAYSKSKEFTWKAAAAKLMSGWRRFA